MNNFGQETYDHISDDFLKSCVYKSVEGLNNLIEKIHFSNDVPENRTVRLKSKKQQLVEVAKEQKWVVKDATDAIEVMIDKGRRLLENYYYNSPCFQKDLEELENHIQTFLSRIIDKNNKDYFAVKRRIYALLVELNVISHS